MLKEAAHLSLQFYLPKKPLVLKPCLLMGHMQKCAVRRSSMTCWVARRRKFTAVGVDGPGFYFVWLQVFPLHYHDPFPWRIIVWADTSPYLRLLQPTCLLLSLVKVCQEEYSLGQKPAMVYGGENGDPGP